MTGTGRLAAAVLALLRAVPLLLVLDGLEVVQEGPAGDGFGRLLDGTLREVLAGACQQPHGGLVVLTSRFPFADLEAFDGGSARMLEVPPFTPAEGAALLAAAGGGWLAEDERRALVAAVDGHALAAGCWPGCWPTARPPATWPRCAPAWPRPPAPMPGSARCWSSTPGGWPRRTGTCWPRCRCSPGPSRPGRCWRSPGMRRSAPGWPGGPRPWCRPRCATGWAGWPSWHPDGTISAHPLVRDTFRPLVMAAAGTAAETALAGMPAGTVTSRADALRVVEAIELLLDAGQWQPADDLYRSRCRHRLRVAGPCRRPGSGSAPPPHSWPPPPAAPPAPPSSAPAVSAST